MKNFWTKLKKPFTALAPMDGVTDTVFRQIVANVGKPDVFFTEFISIDGLCSAGRERLKSRWTFSQEERPIVAQIWGTDPEKFCQAAKFLSDLGFDGIDINMGCPDHQVVKVGAGAATILNPQLAKEIIEAVKMGAPDLPISVKTRIGFDKVQTEEWIEFLLKQNLVALTVHGRTAKEKSDPPANWEEIGKAVKIRNKLGVKTLILGNGDVKSLDEVKEKVEKFGVDGVMIGRGVFENIWVFNSRVDPTKKTPAEKLEVLLNHVRLADEFYDNHKYYEPLKKFFKIYANHFEGASALRVKLMETHSRQEVEKLLSSKI
jgi:nifR3 family TIM-barrel protein